VGYRVYWGLATGVYEGYFAAATTSFAFAADTGHVEDDASGVGNTGTATIIHAKGAGSVNMHRNLYGAIAKRGLSIEITNVADISTVVYRPR
jgi:hypothetical protein